MSLPEGDRIVEAEMWDPAQMILPLKMALSENRVQNAAVYHNFPHYFMGINQQMSLYLYTVYKCIIYVHLFIYVHIYIYIYI